MKFDSGANNSEMWSLIEVSTISRGLLCAACAKRTNGRFTNCPAKLLRAGERTPILISRQRNVWDHGQICAVNLPQCFIMSEMARSAYGAAPLLNASRKGATNMAKVFFCLMTPSVR
ncbi:RND transporter [Anopheles sinensis]|uniref:RND transporter n=1 Tax=Anopheles sinensis TaxID=74873 RepID=A0A084VH38_ANOSI|nr:RND transporter [Anopheles sinensis]